MLRKNNPFTFIKVAITALLLMSTKVSVLFLIFNRPHTTARVFEAIRQAKPSRLYVAGDGARENREGEAEKVAEARKIVTQVDWPCELRTLFRDKNLGCKKAVSSAISWFFEKEEQGIILEDDCLPHPDFFQFCEVLLDYYANDKRIFVITGTNFQNGQKRGNASYYFSKYPHIWGWATWRRAWKYYDVDISFWPKWLRSEDWLRKVPNRVERRYWQKIFDQTYQNKIDTWDYQWTASVWYTGGLTATPNVNLVSNIGYGTDATRTLSYDDPLANQPTYPMERIQHPEQLAIDEKADEYDFNERYLGKYMYFPKNVLYLCARIVRKLSNYYLNNSSY